MTGVSNADSYDSMFQIKEGEGQPACPTGHPVKCGDVIRLEHANTNKNLHSSDDFRAPLSRRQEVCGFGADGEGDEKDNWVLSCADK